MKFLFLKKCLSSESGFSLLEIAIVLSILGLLGTLTLPLLSQYHERQALQITQENQKRVIEALESYLLHHELLPAPADPKEASDQSESRSSNPDMPEKKGIVPYRTLGLPEKTARDGYGHYMTYAVADDASTVDKENKVTDFCGSYKGNRIEIRDRSNENVLNPSEQNEIAFVLISHGPQGLNGPYSSNDSAEKINNEAAYKNDKIIFVTYPYSTHSDHPFRHQIQWRTKQEFAGFCKTRRTGQILSKSLEDLLSEHSKLCSKGSSFIEEKAAPPSIGQDQDDSNHTIYPSEHDQADDLVS